MTLQQSGVKQGDILGPMLFTFYLTAIMISWRAKYDRPLCLYHTKMDDVLTGRAHLTQGEEFSVPDSQYADDTAILFTSRESLNEGVPNIMAHFKRWGMEIHSGDRHAKPIPRESKTEILFVSKPEHMYDDTSSYDDTDLSAIELGSGRYIPVVDKFCYLGSWLARDARDEIDVVKRVAKAGNAFGALRKSVSQSLKISLHAKKFVYNRLILPVLLYGSHTWCLREKDLNQLRMFQARCLRAMCRVTRIHTREHRISTKDLLERVGITPIDNLVSINQLKWSGHVMRMTEERLPRKMISSWVKEPRPKGAPQSTYGRGLYKALAKVHLTRHDWHEKAKDREIWRDMIDTLK